MKRKIWKIKTLCEEAERLSKKYNISLYLAQLLINRNVPEEEFYSFLNPNINNLYSPLLLPDIEKAYKRIKRALEEKEKVMVVGDYDVDGIVSLVIFNEFAKEFPSLFSFYIPDRLKEGYGLNKNLILKAKKWGAGLIITFDCGTNSFEEVNLAKSLGIDTIIVDHHYPKDNFDDYFAFINPKRKDSKYPFYDLTSACLSFKLLQFFKDNLCKEVLDLVALSLVCDVVPLRGENRILLKEGLQSIRKTKRLAIKALCDISKLKQEVIDTFHIGYILGPRINASGRIFTAQNAFNLFLNFDKDSVYAIALKLEECNQIRKKIEMEILKEAEEKIENDYLKDYAIVVCGNNWHPGVLGIVASRLTEKYYKPSFVISFEENLGRGSARSIENLHIIDLLDHCKDYLQNYGGHKKAAGIQIFKEDLEIFKEKLNFFIRESLESTQLVPSLNIDLKINFSEINNSLIEELETLKPFGEENPPPIFATFGVSKKSLPQKINNGYSIWFKQDQFILEGIIYDKELLEIINYGEFFDIVYTLNKNEYYNTPRLIIRDVRLGCSEI